MSDPEQGWSWWAYIVGRCCANLPRAAWHPLELVDALINLERDVHWPAEIRGAGLGSLTLAERLFLRWLCTVKHPQLAFEFGTGRGWTTHLLAEYAPQVYTLDLPGRADLPTRHGIHQLVGDSTEFDIRPFLGKMDLVFVDGGHDHRTVASDTVAAYRMRALGGVIVWHDCNIQHPDVWRFLKELRRSYPIIRVEGTRLAVDFGSLWTGPLP